MYRFSFFFICFCLALQCEAQMKWMHGVVRDADNASPVPFASVYLVESDASALTDSLGSFSFRVPELQTVHLRVVMVGYETVTLTIASAADSIDVLLVPMHVDLHEVTVSGILSQSRDQNPFHIESRQLSDLNSIAAINLGEAVARIPGVYRSNTGIGISKPVVRGMQGMRVVTVWNGLRVESQQWGGDHGMGISDVGLGSVEVIKGPASLLYGADALAGVVYFNDLPHVAVNTRVIECKTTIQSNTAGLSQQAYYRESRERVRWQLGASYANHADYQLPDGRFALNTRFNEAALKSLLSFSGKHSVHHMRYSFNQTLTGIPGESEDSVITPASFWTTTQNRQFELPAQLFINQFASSDNKWFTEHSEVQLLAGFTSNRLMEFEDDKNIASMHMTLSNALYSFKWIRRMAQERLRVIGGLQGMHQWNRNAPNAPERLIPNARTFDQGGYATLQYAFSNWNVHAGARYDRRLLHASIPDSASFVKSYGGFNASAGAVYHCEWATVRASFSTGYRAPHLTELLSNGFHHSALRYELGDATLRPEYARQADVTAEITGEHLVLVYNPFVNSIRNYIALQPLGYSVDGMPAFEYRALSEVVYYGNDVGLHYHPHFAHEFHLETTWSYIRAQAPTDSSIALLPPQRIQTSLRYTLEGDRTFRITELNVMHTYMAAQRMVAFMETPSSDYNLLDAAIAFEWKQTTGWEFRVGVKNILNERCIDHLSRLKNIQMPAPGRNFYLSIQYRFNS